MLKLEILLALFATMLKVQAKSDSEYDYDHPRVPECRKHVGAQAVDHVVIVPSETAIAANEEFGREGFEKRRLHRHVKKCSKKHHRPHLGRSVVSSDEEFPIYHQYQAHGEHAHKHCGIKKDHAHVEGHHHHVDHIHHKHPIDKRHKHPAAVEHELHEEFKHPRYEDRAVHVRRHAHKHCGVTEGHIPHKIAHHKIAKHAHKNCHVEGHHHHAGHVQHGHKSHRAHKINHMDKHNRHGHPIEHIKKHCPLAAHLNSGNSRHHHKRFITQMPGKDQVDHDSNDFTSFEVAQLDILRVTKLDSEHAHDLHNKVPSKGTKAAIKRRAAEFKEGSHKLHAHKDSHKKKAHHGHSQGKSCKLNRHSHKSHHKTADSDDDVREHIKAIKKAHRDLKESHKKGKGKDSDDSEDKKSKTGAMIKSKLQKHHEDKKSEKKSKKDSDKKKSKKDSGKKKSKKDSDKKKTEKDSDKKKTEKDSDKKKTKKDSDKKKSEKDSDEKKSEKDTDSKKTEKETNSKDYDDKPKESDSDQNKDQDSDKGAVKGFKNALKKTFNFGKKTIKEKFGDKKEKSEKSDSKSNQDLHLKNKDRVRLVADLKAISELDREALQYLDTSCGPVKSLAKKKKVSRRAKKAQKKEEDKKKKQKKASSD